MTVIKNAVGYVGICADYDIMRYLTGAIGAFYWCIHE